MYADVLPRGTRQQQANRRAEIKAVKAASAARLKEAQQKGQARMASSLDSVNAIACKHRKVDEDLLDKEFEASLHPSHFLKAVHGHAEAVFYKRCGAYSKGGPLRGLKIECLGYVAPAHASQHKLMSWGIMPARGARLPSSLRRRRVMR